MFDMSCWCSQTGTFESRCPITAFFTLKMSDCYISFLQLYQLPSKVINNIKNVPPSIIIFNCKWTIVETYINYTRKNPHKQKYSENCRQITYNFFHLAHNPSLIFYNYYNILFSKSQEKYFWKCPINWTIKLDKLTFMWYNSIREKEREEKDYEKQLLQKDYYRQVWLQH